MTRRIFTSNKSGFSLIELCIVLAIISILAGAITPVLIKRIQIKAGEKTAMEMSTIQQAATAYFVANKAWPVSLQAMQSAGYLNSAWVTNNPWQNPYIISSTVSSFTVTTSVPQEWTNLVARDLPTSSVSVNVVTSTIPAPGAPDQSLPIGAIVMWSGSVSNIPVNFQLCDGTNGTPDIRDKFVVGARQDSGATAMTTVSGSLTKTGGEAYHTLTIDEMPSHAHSYTQAVSGSGWGGDKGSQSTGSRTSATGYTGGGRPHNTLPPYYALCFIMKMQ